MLSLLLTTLAPALIPAAADMVRGITRKITGEAPGQPQSVAEHVQLTEAGTNRLKALADLDRPSGNISQWVADLRASFRYLACGAILFNAFFCPIWTSNADQVATSWQAASSAFSFIFGDRMYAYIKRR